MLCARKLAISIAVLAVVGGLLFVVLRGNLVTLPEGATRSRAEPSGTTSREQRPAGETANSNRATASRHLARGPGAIEGRVWHGNVPAAALVEIRVRPVRLLLDPPAETTPVLAGLDVDHGGEFRLSGLPSGRYEIRATARDGARGRAVTSIWRGGTVHVAVRLRPASFALHARARFADGRPFAGHAGIDGSFSPTDEEGRFLIDGLTAADHDLALVAPGRLRVSKRVTLPHDGELEIVVDEDLTRVRGRVVAADDESPIPGARVRGRSGLFEVATTCDAAGGFTLPLPSSGVISVTAAGFASLRYASWGGEPEVTLRLIRGARIEGRVLASEDGSPLGGIGIYLDPLIRGTPLAVSGVDGTYALTDLPARDLTLVAYGEGRVDAALTGAGSFAVNPLIVKTTVGRTTTHDILVVRTGRVTGEVLAPDGQPAAGASITARPTKGWMRRHSLIGITGPDGRYVVEGLVPGQDHGLVLVSADGTRVTHDRPVVVEPEATTRADFRIPGPRWIELTVVDAASGAPVVMAGVTLHQGGRHFLTDEDGRARLGPIGPGTATFRVDHGHYLCPARSQEIAEGGPEDVVLRLTRGLPLAGRVVPPAGIPGFRGFAYVTGARALGEYRMVRRQALDAEGRFHVGPFPAGTYDIVISARTPTRWSSEPVRCVAGREDHVIVMPPPPPVVPPEERPVMVIRWVGPDGRRALGGTALVLDGASPVRRLGTGGIGEAKDAFRWTIRDGVESVLIEVSGAKAADGSSLAAVRHGPVPAEAGEVTIRSGTSDARIVLPTAIRVTVRVLGPDGDPVPHARVTAVPARARTPTVSGITNAEGIVGLPHLAPGTAHDLRVTASRPNAAAPNLAILVPNVVIAEKEVTVRLGPGLTIHGRVLGAEEAVVYGTLEGSQIVAYVTQDGTFALRGLTPETWTVQVFAREAGRPASPREVRAGEMVEFDLTGR